MDLNTITDELVQALQGLEFTLPVSHVYNPLEYARKPYDRYIERYGTGSREIILLGMNPGPWGMAQTGVPFGEIDIVRNWLQINAPVGQPAVVHPKKPVNGFECTRSEVSGRRLWGWARNRFGTPERFFDRFFVANYCPLLFIEAGGRNRTPNTICAIERKPLLEICDLALQHTVKALTPRFVVGVGEFAATRARIALANTDIVVGRINHPSPANPRANRGWDALVENEMAAMGICFE
jgi:single-strand selective monofunctional uracil DNA glycosylase